MKKITTLFVCWIGFLCFGSIAYSQALVYETEPNESFFAADAVALGDTLMANIGTVGDQDYFVVNVPVSGVIYVSVLNVAPIIDIRLRAYDPFQSQIWDNNVVNGAPYYANRLYCTPGNYYFRFSDLGDDEFYPILHKIIFRLDTTDVYECNNTFQDAKPILLGDTVRAAINSVGDLDFFKLNIPRAGVFDWSITNIGSNVDMEVLIYNSNQTLLDQYGWYNSNGTPISDRHLVCDSGLYYFQLKDFDNTDSDRQLYKFVVNLDTSDVYECNNSFQDSKPIQLGDTIRAAINAWGDNDYFSVNIPRTGVFDWSISNVPNGMDPEIFLYNSNQNQIYHFGWNNSNGIPLADRLMICDPGLYYIRLKDWDNDNADRQLYNFVVILDTTDRYECNPDFLSASPIVVCDTIVGAIGVNGDYDYYQFNALGSQFLSFKLTQVPTNINPRIRVFDAFQNELYNRLLNAGQPVWDSLLIPTTGQYYFRINDEGDNASSLLAYRLQLLQGCIFVGEDIQMPLEVECFPNPFGQEIHVRVTGRTPIGAKAKVWNVLGNLVAEQDIRAAEETIRLDGIPNGPYILEVEAGEARKYFRLLKQ